MSSCPPPDGQISKCQPLVWLWDKRLKYDQQPLLVTYWAAPTFWGQKESLKIVTGSFHAKLRNTSCSFFSVHSSVTSAFKNQIQKRKHNIWDKKMCWSIRKPKHRGTGWWSEVLLAAFCLCLCLCLCICLCLCHCLWMVIRRAVVGHIVPAFVSAGLRVPDWQMLGPGHYRAVGRLLARHSFSAPHLHQPATNKQTLLRGKETAWELKAKTWDPIMGSIPIYVECHNLLDTLASETTTPQSPLGNSMP